MSVKTLKQFHNFLNKLKPDSKLASDITSIIKSKTLNLNPESQIEDKFPFDPYFLNHSSKYLTPQSFMNYSESNHDVDSSRDFDSYFHEEEKSCADSISAVS
eukprot:CAMPEP_0176467130 /NCGR_PEP_ID=MMETSP0127-20121128/38287_1 /TAXON_ID=938130 /ORGANISM="Platyophrya macrostoma, Strain WH" /LENGTH=101 /DNA_ID=CAMNT_0017860395 /DNA_START=290 /DNA_END=592 /DNA_ORIENTATION=-